MKRALFATLSLAMLATLAMPAPSDAATKKAWVSTYRDNKGVTHPGHWMTYNSTTRGNSKRARVGAKYSGAKGTRRTWINAFRDKKGVTHPGRWMTY